MLQKNEKRLSVALSPDFHETLQKYYQQALDKLLPLKEKLRLTDWLIDQIVYKLYGLTPEEVQIVEGRKPSKEEAATS